MEELSSRGRWQGILSSIRRKRPALSAEQIRGVLRQLGQDSRMAGVVLRLGPLHSDWSVIGGLRRHLLELKAAGKRVVVYLPEGGSDKELYLACAADHVAISPAGWLSFVGVASGQLYLKGLLDRLGVTVQSNAQGAFKTAAESLTREAMSGPQREQMQAIVDGRQQLLERALQEKLGDEKQLVSLFEEVAWGPEQAQAVGVVQSITYEEALPIALQLETRDSRWALSAAAFRARRPRRVWRSLRRAPYLGVLGFKGAIRRGGGGGWSGASGIQLHSAVALLRAAREDDQLAGALLYVDSPGGSAMVSDLIHHEVQRLAAVKPVVAFFGAIAASGGYYIAAPCSRIVATWETLTGSIGVVSVRPVLADLMERLGVRPQVVKAAPHADMGSLGRELTRSELEIVDRESKLVYEKFLKVVATGRGKTREQVEPLAAGRVWTAEAALAHGLIDTLGDMPRAISILRELVDDPRRGDLRARPYHPHLPSRPQVVGMDERERQLQQELLARLCPQLMAWDWLLDGSERVACYCPHVLP